MLYLIVGAGEGKGSHPDGCGIPATTILQPGHWTFLTPPFILPCLLPSQEPKSQYMKVGTAIIIRRGVAGWSFLPGRK